VPPLFGAVREPVQQNYRRTLALIQDPEIDLADPDDLRQW
jgi:hypothetical protein